MSAVEPLAAFFNHESWRSTKHVSDSPEFGGGDNDAEPDMEILLPCGTRAMVNRTEYCNSPRTWFFDADGTLRKCTVESQPCPNNDDEWYVPPEVSKWFGEQDRMLTDNSWIVSNQAGVEWGFLTYEAAKFMLVQLAERLNIGEERVLLCPDKESIMRKPEIGMIAAAMAYGIDEADRVGAVMVGDMESDMECALHAGISFIHAEELFG